MRFPRLLQLGIGLLLPATACDDLMRPHGKLEVLLSTSSPVVTPEPPVTITVSAVNEGTSPVTVRTNTCPETYVVTDDRGATVGPGPVICPLIVLTEVLGPGERVDLTYLWTGTTRESIRWPPAKLPAGNYRLRGFMHAEGVRFTSPPVAIEVRRP